MPNYRRLMIPGATVFITFVTHNRVPFLIQPGARKALHNAWMYVSKRHPFSTDAVCLLPDHLHMLITLPENNADYSLRVREIKRLFTKNFVPDFDEISKRNISRQNKKEAALWQRRFWEHTIRDDLDYQNHFDYIHFNPVKHQFVDDPALWEWSSFHRYVRAGIYEKDWGITYGHKMVSGEFGEV